MLGMDWHHKGISIPIPNFLRILVGKAPNRFDAPATWDRLNIYCQLLLEQNDVNAMAMMVM